MEQKTLAYEAAGQTRVIHLPREIDHHNCKKLKIETDLLLEENYIRRIVFDFSHTQFMDSSVIGVLLGRYKQMRASVGAVPYYGAGAQVARILTVGVMAKLIRGVEDKESVING